MRIIASLDEKQILEYVKARLLENGGENSDNSFQKFRIRSEHCRRVKCWCEKIAENESVLSPDWDVLLLSALFHDIGYNRWGIRHESYGAELFAEFADIHGLKKELTDRVVHHILHHSQKERMLVPRGIDVELQILMEADLLDEEGVMGIVADCMTEGMRGKDCEGYIGALNRMSRFASEILEISPMVTPYAQKCWREKQKELVYFLERYRACCFLE